MAFHRNRSCPVLLQTSPNRSSVLAPSAFHKARAQADCQTPTDPSLTPLHHIIRLPPDPLPTILLFLLLWRLLWRYHPPAHIRRLWPAERARPDSVYRFQANGASGRGRRSVPAVWQRHGQEGDGEFACHYAGAWVYELGTYGSYLYVFCRALIRTVLVWCWKLHTQALGPRGFAGDRQRDAVVAEGSTRKEGADVQ